MVEVDTGRFTVGVFQDVAWATKGLAALTDAGFPRDALAIIAKESTETAALIAGISSSAIGVNWDTTNGVPLGEKAFPDGYDALPKDRIYNVVSCAVAVRVHVTEYLIPYSPGI